MEYPLIGRLEGPSNKTIGLLINRSVYMYVYRNGRTIGLYILSGERLEGRSIRTIGMFLVGLYANSYEWIGCWLEGPTNRTNWLSIRRPFDQDDQTVG